MRVILTYKNFHKINPQISHIGLGCAALNTSKVLQKVGIPCEVWPIVDSNELRQLIRVDRSEKKQPPITHVIISAPWIRTQNLEHLCSLFPDIQFVVNCHSNVGFLQADLNGTKLLREALSLHLPNFKVSSNSMKMSNWMKAAFDYEALYLPNLYSIESIVVKPTTDNSKPLRVGVFGAVRPLKNVMTSFGACLVLSKELNRKIELFISTGRTEGGGDSLLRAAKALIENTNVSLVEANWRPWPEFRKLVGEMDLLLQMSYSESFNMVTADGIAEGVPSVVSSAIDWAPHFWKANSDDATSVAHIAMNLMMDRNLAMRRGYEYLLHFIDQGIQSWLKFIHE